MLNAFVTYGCWWAKPKDIATAAFVDLPPMTDRQREVFENLSMEATYDVLDPNQKQDMNIAWYVVARDCRDDEVLVMGQLGDDDVEKVRGFDTGEKDVKRMTSSDISVKSVMPEIVEEGSTVVITEWDANLYMTRWWPSLCLLGASFGAVHLISWKAVFLTEVEMWLWRSSAVISVATAVLCMQFRTMSMKWEGFTSIIKIGSPLLYIISRVVMAVETFAGLRAMEAATYMTYQIWNYWFHFF